MPSVRRAILNHNLAIPLCIGTLVWVGILVYWHWAGFSIYQGDLQGYIDWSYHITRHTDYASHMPAYPFLILVARLITFHCFSDTFLAQCLGYLTWVAGLFLARAVLERVAPGTLKAGLLLFALFPLLGVWSAANPVADLLAYATALAALLFALHNRFGAFAITSAAGLFTHQAFYPLFAMLALACLVNRMPWRYLFACGVPFLLYYAAIAVQKGDINWILSYHAVTHNAVRQGGLPIFDGIIGTALRGSAKNEIKAAILMASFLCSAVLGVYCCRRKNWVLLSLCVPVILAGILSTQHVAWVIFRLSKLLLIPGCWWAVKQPRVLRVFDSVAAYAAIALLLAASQLVWAHYSIIYANWLAQ